MDIIVIFKHKKKYSPVDFIGRRLKDWTGDQRGGSEWEPLKVLIEGDGYSNKMNTANQNTSPTQLPKLAKTT
jgi:hypothetical protein